MRTIILAVVLGMTGLGMDPAVAQHNIRCAAPTGNLQPTIAGVKHAQSAKGGRTATDIRADEAIERSENKLRDKLIICRGC